MADYWYKNALFDLVSDFLPVTGRRFSEILYIAEIPSKSIVEKIVVSCSDLIGDALLHSSQRFLHTKETSSHCKIYDHKE